MLCLSAGPAVAAPRERAMEPRLALRVTRRGDTRTFLLPDPARTAWADVEAMVSAGRLREVRRGVRRGEPARPGQRGSLGPRVLHSTGC